MSVRALRAIAFVATLAIAALVHSLVLDTPVQAQNETRDKIVTIVNVYPGTQATSVSVILEYTTNTFDDQDNVIVSYPPVHVKRCDDCEWEELGRPRAPKRVYNQPTQIQVTYKLPELCPSTDYSARVIAGATDVDPLLEYGFGFTTPDGATLAGMSGSIDGTTATVDVEGDDDGFARETVYVRYRIHGSDDEWTTTNRESSSPVSFTITDLSDGNYYEFEASMGEDFLSCAVLRGFGTIGSPDDTAVTRPPDLPTNADPFYAIPLPTITTNEDDDDSADDGDGGGGGGGFSVAEDINLSPQFRESAVEMRSVPENSVVGAEVGKPIMAWDPEGDPLTFSLRGEDAETFRMEPIDDHSAQIVVGPDVLLDYEVKNVYFVELVVSDMDGKSAVRRLQIRLKNVELPGKANYYDLANNHNELVERSELQVAAVDYFQGLITKPDLAGITKLYYTTAFSPVKFSLLPQMISKYDFNRDSVIDRQEVLAALKDFFTGRISKAAMQEVVKSFFTTVAEHFQQPVESESEQSTPATDSEQPVA